MSESKSVAVEARETFVLAVFAAFAAAAGVACGSDIVSADRASAAGDTVVASHIATIGQIEGEDEYLLGDVVSVAAGPHGNIYIADRIGSSVRAYDQAGLFLGTIGAKGEGPGEFQWPADLTFDPQGQLIVRDSKRITVLDSRATSVLPDSVVRTQPLGLWANLSSRRARSDGVLYYYPAYLFRADEPDRYFYLVFDTDGQTRDTLAVPTVGNLQFIRRASYRTGPRGGRLVDGVNRAPFEPHASWDVTVGGSIVVTSGESYRIHEIGPHGDTLMSIDRPMTRSRHIPRQELRDSLAAFKRRLFSVPVLLDRVSGMSELARRGALPDSLPAIVGLHVSVDNRIWVQRWPAPGAGDSRFFDVFDSTGNFARTVVIPAPILSHPPPHVSAELFVGVVQDPETEVQSVVVFRVGATR